jgi:hypothetical protein
MIATLALLFATAFPASNRTAWMRPESFHLGVGMSRSEAMKVLDRDGWKTRTTKSAGEIAFDYSESCGVTLHFRKERVTAIRFELFAFMDQAYAAFDEEKAFLRTTFGAPVTSTKVVLVYNRQLPNIMAVLSSSKSSAAGRQGLGMLVVNYYDPVVK